MQDFPSQCRSEGSPGHGQTGEGNFGKGLVRLSVNRVFNPSSRLPECHTLPAMSAESQGIKVYFDNFALLDFNETWQMRCLVSNIC